MINDEYLAVIMVMKVRRDAFFLWLLAVYSGGALAPTRTGGSASAAGTPTAPRTPAALRLKGKKRLRGSPPQVPAAAAAVTPTGGSTSNASRGASSGGVSDGSNAGAPDSSGNETPSRTGTEAGVAVGRGLGDRSEGGVGVLPGRAEQGSGGGGEGGASGHGVCASVEPTVSSPQSDAATALVDRVRAVNLLLDGQQVATAHLHPNFTLFHGVDAPPTVVAVFINEVDPGSKEAIYPFGQDNRLCLEKGNPSPTPVLLHSIPTGYRLAWPVASVGYVTSLRVLLFSCVPLVLRA